MTPELDIIRNQRLHLLKALIDAWWKQHADFGVTTKEDAYYVIHHPGLTTHSQGFEVPRDDIDAMVKTGYLIRDRCEEPGTWTLRIPYQGFDVFDAQREEQARPEFERRVVFDIMGDQGEPAERTIDLKGHVYTLRATPNRDTGEWTARVFRYTLTADAPAFRQPILDRRSELHDQAAIVRTMQAIGPTPHAALANLEATLRSSIASALPDNASRRSTD